MAPTKLLYAVRMPVDLKRLLESKAATCGRTVSELVIAACWASLDGPAPALEPDPLHRHYPERFSAPYPLDLSGVVATKRKEIEDAPSAMEQAKQPIKMNDAMARFLEKVPVNTRTVSSGVMMNFGQGDYTDTMQTKVCVSCDSPLREVKGKLACVDRSCGMYGVEQKGKRW
jgi:hypothetical protein